MIRALMLNSSFRSIRTLVR